MSTLLVADKCTTVWGSWGHFTVGSPTTLLMSLVRKLGSPDTAPEVSNLSSVIIIKEQTSQHSFHSTSRKKKDEGKNIQKK